MIVAQRHLNYICREFAAHYNCELPHSARLNLPPAFESEPVTEETAFMRDVVCSTRLGALLRSCLRRAA